MDLQRHTGPQSLGPAYRHMLENDAHAPGSVDRVIVQRMMRLCSETAAYLHDSHTSLAIGYVRGSRPALEGIVSRCAPESDPIEARVAAIAAFTRGLDRGDEVARISKKWVSLADRYGIRVDEGEDDVLILACAIIVDAICHEED